MQLQEKMVKMQSLIDSLKASNNDADDKLKRQEKGNQQEIS